MKLRGYWHGVGVGGAVRGISGGFVGVIGITEIGTSRFFTPPAVRTVDVVALLDPTPRVGVRPPALH